MKWYGCNNCCVNYSLGKCKLNDKLVLGKLCKLRRQEMTEIKLEDRFECESGGYVATVTEYHSVWLIHIAKDEKGVADIYTDKSEGGTVSNIEVANLILNTLGFHVEEPIYWDWDNESYEEFLSRYSHEFSRKDWKDNDISKWVIEECENRGRFCSNIYLNYKVLGAKYFKNEKVTNNIIDFLNENYEKVKDKIWN